MSFDPAGFAVCYVAPTSPLTLEAGRIAQWGDISGAAPPAQAWPGSLRVAQAQFDEGWTPEVIDWAEAAGLNLQAIRFNFLRSQTQTMPPPAKYVAALDAMKAKGLKHYLTLFDGGVPYAHDPQVFAAWAVQVLLWHVANYPGVCVAAEIWNEPDGNWPVSAAEYLVLAQAVHTAVRAHPELDHIPLAGNAGAHDMAYWDALIAGGFLDLIGFASHHLYDAPELLGDKFDQLKAKFVAAGKPSLKLFISEYGAEGVPGEVHRNLTMLKARGAMGASYFISRDYPTFANAGLLTQTGDLKPSGAAWVEWHNRIGQEATFVSRDTLNSACHSYKFTKAGATIRSMWATVDTPVFINGVSTTLTTTPIYVDGDVSVALATGGDVELASVTTNFTVAAQGAPFNYLSRLISTGADTQMIADVPGNKWVLQAGSFCAITSNSAHPISSNKAVRQWVAPAAGRLKVVGAVRRTQAGGDGSDVWLLHNTTERFRRLALPSQSTFTTFSQVFEVVVGDKIEFVVGPNVSQDFDNVTWNNCFIYSTADAVNQPDVTGAPPTGSGFNGTMTYVNGVLTSVQAA